MRSREVKKGTETPGGGFSWLGVAEFWGCDIGCCCGCWPSRGRRAADVLLERRRRRTGSLVNRDGRERRLDALGHILGLWYQRRFVHDAVCLFGDGMDGCRRGGWREREVKML